MPEFQPTDASYDAEAVRAKYLSERDKRLVPGRASIRDLKSTSPATVTTRSRRSSNAHRSPTMWTS
jgi:hypothetical protein